MARKSLVYKKGRAFAAVGWGKYGPYAVGAYRYKRAIAKAAVGTKGATVGARYRIYRGVRVGGEYNITHKRRAIEVRFGRRRYRIEA